MNNSGILQFGIRLFEFKQQWIGGIRNLISNRITIQQCNLATAVSPEQQALLEKALSTKAIEQRRSKSRCGGGKRRKRRKSRGRSCSRRGKRGRSRSKCGSGSRGGGKKKKNAVKGKVAIVTGGQQGIGYSMAKLLLACGAKGVFIGDLSEKLGRKAVCKLSKSYGEKKVIFMKTDVTKKKDLKRMFKCTKNYFKRLDIVVNNAGILQDEIWPKMIRINCDGLVNGTLLAFKEMGKHKGGKGGTVVNVASIVGLQSFTGSPLYGSTKHFVIGFTRNMGVPFYYKQTKVKVMAMCPGVTETKMVFDANQHGLRQFKGTGKLTEKELASLPPQPADACGCHLIKMLEVNKNGSIWVSEDSETYRVKLPNRLKMRISEGKGSGKKGKRGRKGRGGKCRSRGRSRSRSRSKSKRRRRSRSGSGCH